MRRNTRPDKKVLSGFRRFLKAQGFLNPKIQRGSFALFPGEMYSVTFYDPISDKTYCRAFNEYDMKCVLHAQDVFWRYVK